MRPFLKWAGGKRRLVATIREHLLAGPAKRVVEPFVGSAAVSLALHEEVDELVLNDSNEDLAHVYLHLKERPRVFIEKVREWFVPENNEADAYYANRDRFNAAPHGSLERASLFIYLNRHGYNGLCRYNASGLFNVPFGRYEKPLCPDDQLEAVSRVLARGQVTHGDFEPVLDACGEGDAVYCDPPYVPLSRTAHFANYDKDGFGFDDQQRLAAAARRAADRGAVVVISNHDTPATRELYKGGRLSFMDVQRMISRDGDNREKASELLAVFGPGRTQRRRARSA